MSDNFLEEVKKRILEITSTKKKTIFSISTTAKYEENSYMTPVRDCKDFILTGCIIFDQDVVPKILEVIDGFVDIILVDSEKKLPIGINNNLKNGLERQQTVGYVETGSVSRISVEFIKKSKVFEFKPNDLTVNAAWVFLSQRLKFLSGKKISILGTGNIGSKLALKLVECGAEVHLYRRDSYKGYQIAQALNLIKPENVLSNVHFFPNALHASFLSDVVIGTTDGYPIIDADIVKSLNKGCLIVDLGKNNLSTEAIEIASQNSMEIYRADVTVGIESYIYEVLKMNDILENSYGRKDLGFCTIIGGGFFGNFGDIVVDSINNPQNIIGVSQGNGLLKSKINDKDRSNIEKLKKEFINEQ